MPGPIVTREVKKFRANPLSVRNAMALIVIATVVTTFASGILMWIVDRENFPNVGVALWFAIQTVTTVGYGDVTPTTVPGRLIASLVLVEAIAFLSIITAAITSTFVEQVRRQRELEGGGTMSHEVVAALADLSAKVEQLEASLRELRDDPNLRSDRDR